MSTIKTVLCYSGGLDSTVLLYHLKYRLGQEVYPLLVYYGQRHGRELQYAYMMVKDLVLDYRLLDLTPLVKIMGGSSQTSDLPVPEGHYAEESMKATVVPNRNMVLLSLATAWAVSLKAQFVAYAAHAGDHTIYPDCRPEFFEPLGEAIRKCDWHRVEPLSPFMIGVSKADIIKLGNELGVPFERTYSCLTGDTEILTLNGCRPIIDIVPGDWVWGYTERGWTPSQVQHFMVQGIKPVYEVVVKDAVGKVTSFRATGDHRLMLRVGGYVRVDEVSRGERLMQSSVYSMTVTRKRNSGDKTYLAVKPHNNWKEKTEYLHRIAAEFFGHDLTGDVVVHHRDDDTFNNLPTNLEVLPRGEHSKLTDRSKLAGSSRGNRVKSIKKKLDWASLTNEEYQARCAAISKGRLNHTLVSVRPVGDEPTYDIQTTTENFALGSGIFVHNCYKGGEKHCGKCGTCVERREAFQVAGVTDPTEYEG